MQFFVQENTILAKATDPDRLKERVPGMVDSLDAAQDLRQFNRETGWNGWMYNKEFRHVATIKGPVLSVAEILDPDFLNGNGKRNFYQWLDMHPEYCAYDRRKESKRGDLLVMQDGKPVI